MKKFLIVIMFLCFGILAGCGGNNNSTPGSKPPAPVVLQSIQVTPSASSIASGLSQQFTATGTYSDNSSKNLTNLATWSSSNAAVATVSNAGAATGKAQGPATITATQSGVSGSATLTVTAPALVSLVVSPASPSLALGTTVQFTATGSFTDGSTQNLTTSVEWVSANPSVASINVNGAPGLAKALTPGISTITAISGSASSSAALTVTNATLTSITVTPASASLPLGTLQQFTATGVFSDGTTQDITSSANWSSSSVSVASITVSGLVTARNLGTVTITASSGSINGDTSATVNAADLASIAIVPGNVSIAASTSQQFSAIGTFNDGSTRNLTSQVTWSSSNIAVAKVSSGGLARASSLGTATITATLGSASASATLDVTNAQIVSISITPANSTIAPATKLSLTATGSFSDSSTQVITVDVTWASDNVATATINGAGIVTAVAPGVANISATFNGVTTVVPINISSATLMSIAVNPPTSVVAPASLLSYTAIGAFSDGSTQAITNAVTWTSSANNVASINSVGQVTGQSPGTATIMAQEASVSGSAALVVESSRLASLQITPATATVAQQTEAQFSAIGIFEDGSTQDLTSSVSWTASPLSVATISDVAGTRGLATGLTPGSATITALFAGEVGTALLSVTNATLTTVTVAPSPASIALGSSQQFTATGSFSDGTTQDLTSQVTWTSASVNVATITGSGLANTVATGTTTITASINGVSGTTVLTVY